MSYQKKGKSKSLVFEKITITLPEETVEKLKKMAVKEKRTTSNMVRCLIDNARIR